MAKFKKTVVRSGLHLVSDGKGGRRFELITPDRLTHWANQHNKMVASGLKVPAPSSHDGSDPHKTTSSKENYGWWESAEVIDTVDDQGNPCKGLQQIIDVPLEEDAVRIGNTVKDTSIYTKEEFSDGKGNIWKDIIAHTALVTQPIEKGQPNFELIDKGDLAIAMSHRVPVSDSIVMDLMPEQLLSTGSVSPTTLIQTLKKVAGIALPDDTDACNILERLNAALIQKDLSENKTNSSTLETAPSSSKQQEVPVIMSQQPNASVPVATPAPVAPSTIEMSVGKVKELEDRNKQLMNLVISNEKEKLVSRVSNLRSKGIISDAVFTSQVEPMLNSFQMSFDDQGVRTPSAIEQYLSLAESITIPTSTNYQQPSIQMASNVDGKLVIQNHPNPNFTNGDPAHMTDQRADEIVAMMLGDSQS